MPGTGPARIAVVVNPISGSAGRERELARFVAALRRGGAEAEVRPTRAAGDASVLAAEAAASGAACVVAAGGDGTLNEVVAGLRDLGGAAPAVAVLPFGTSNLVAREIGVRRGDPEAAAETVLRGLTAPPTPFDVADVTAGAPPADGAPPRGMVACAGIGWDAHVVRELAARRRGHIRFSTWFRPIAGALRTYRFPRFRVRCGPSGSGGEAEGVLAIVLNAAPYAAFFRPCRDARPDDGLLDVLVVREASAAVLARLAWKAWRGDMSSDRAVVRMRGAEIAVEACAEPAPVQIDGDVGGETPVRILVRPGAIRILRPRAEGATP